MTRGFVLGKFLPPHIGHVLLCDFGRAYADLLTILVCSLEREPIAGRQRLLWMQEMFPGCRVLHLDEEVPQEPSEHPRFWEIWKAIVGRFHPEPVDFVFASEPYGLRLAAELGARFVPVDPGRLAAPVSGSAIRADPFAHWDFIPPAVRPYFLKRVCIFGPESTGKSTLARRLAQRFRTVFAPEYGRIHTDAFGVECTADDLIRIAKGHQALTNAVARQANRLLVLDTDPVLTAVWSQMLLKRRDPRLDEFSDTADLYLMTDVDVPWFDDGTRYFPDHETRQVFARACRSELETRGLPHVVLSGGWEERFEQAVSVIEARFPGV